MFARLCEAMGQPALKDDPRYRDHASRGVNQAELDEAASDTLKDVTYVTFDVEVTPATFVTGGAGKRSG